MPGNPGLLHPRTAAQIAGIRSLQDLFRNSCGGLARHQKADDRTPYQLHTDPILHRRGNLPAAPGRPQTPDPCENMSNDTQNSRDSGDSRRRRSRGGQNRRNNNNSNRSDGRTEGRQEGGGRRQDGNRSGGGRGKQGSSSGKPQRRPMPAPVQLSWWQKLLKTIGLYKEPVRPPRPERRPDKQEPKGNREPRRTKTRDARSDTSRDESRNNSSRDESRSEESPRGNKRGGNRRGERDGNRPRGGDPSSVENRRVYVGNLSYDVTESDLEELFKGVGAVRRVEIVYNRNTHRSKGYGFIEMIDIDEAKRTVEVLHDQFFMGRKLTVSGAKSKDHEEAENEDEKNIAENQAMPPLAPVKPEVTSLIDEPVTEEKPVAAEPKVQIATTEENHEVPTEEFSPEADTSEEIKEEPKS